MDGVPSTPEQLTSFRVSGSGGGEEEQASFQPVKTSDPQQPQSLKERQVQLQSHVATEVATTSTGEKKKNDSSSISDHMTAEGMYELMRLLSPRIADSLLPDSQGDPRGGNHHQLDSPSFWSGSPSRSTSAPQGALNSSFSLSQLHQTVEDTDILDSRSRPLSRTRSNFKAPGDAADPLRRSRSSGARPNNSNNSNNNNSNTNNNVGGNRSLPEWSISHKNGRKDGTFPSPLPPKAQATLSAALAGSGPGAMAFTGGGLGGNLHASNAAQAAATLAQNSRPTLWGHAGKYLSGSERRAFLYELGKYKVYAKEMSEDRAWESREALMAQIEAELQRQEKDNRKRKSPVPWERSRANRGEGGGVSPRGGGEQQPPSPLSMYPSGDYSSTTVLQGGRSFFLDDTEGFYRDQVEWKANVERSTEESRMREKTEAEWKELKACTFSPRILTHSRSLGTKHHQAQGTDLMSPTRAASAKFRPKSAPRERYQQWAAKSPSRKERIARHYDELDLHHLGDAMATAATATSAAAAAAAAATAVSVGTGMGTGPQGKGKQASPAPSRVTNKTPPTTMTSSSKLFSAGSALDFSLVNSPPLSAGKAGIAHGIRFAQGGQRRRDGGSGGGGLSPSVVSPSMMTITPGRSRTGGGGGGGGNVVTPMRVRTATTTTSSSTSGRGGKEVPSGTKSPSSSRPRTPICITEQRLSIGVPLVHSEDENDGVPKSTSKVASERLVAEQADALLRSKAKALSRAKEAERAAQRVALYARGDETDRSDVTTESEVVARDLKAAANDSHVAAKMIADQSFWQVANRMHASTSTWLERQKMARSEKERKAKALTKYSGQNWNVRGTREFQEFSFALDRRADGRGSSVSGSIKGGTGGGDGGGGAGGGGPLSARSVGGPRSLNQSIGGGVGETRVVKSRGCVAEAARRISARAEAVARNTSGPVVAINPTREEQSIGNAANGSAHVAGVSTRVMESGHIPLAVRIQQLGL